MRQTTTWIERHVEKIVAGAAGAVLLVVLVGSLILSPHTVDVRDGALGPTGLYHTLASRAEQARKSMTSAQPAEADHLRSGLAEMEAAQRGPANQLWPPAAPLRSPLPKVARLNLKLGHIKLADVLPPTKPLVSTGKAAARIPPPREVPVSVTGSGTAAGESGFVFTRDWHWVALAAVINRGAQREAFRKANYDSAGLELIVAGIEAERQERLPGGGWGQARIVEPYLPQRLVGPRQVRLYKDDTGYVVSPRDWESIRDYHHRLSDPKEQDQILRAPFQTYLGDSRSVRDYRAEWAVPRTLTAGDGTELDLTDSAYGLYFPAEESRGRLASVQWSKAREVLSKGWKDAGLQPYLEAVSVLKSIAADQTAAAVQRQVARRILSQYAYEIQTAVEMDQIARNREASIATPSLGPDLDPIWVTDTTVEPGRTYRYRLRLLALNRYAGMASFLADPRDAGTVVIEGEWSPWSGDITVQPTGYLFVMGPEDEQKKTVRVRLYQWSNGLWENGAAVVAAGDTIAIEKGSTQLSYDGVVKSIDFHRRYVEDDPPADATSTDAQPETVAVTLTDSRGVTEEHLAVRDRSLMNSLVRQIREEEQRQQPEERRASVPAARVERSGNGSDHENRAPRQATSERQRGRF